MEFLRYGAVVRGEGVNVGKETNIQVAASNLIVFCLPFLQYRLYHVIFCFGNVKLWLISQDQSVVLNSSIGNGVTVGHSAVISNSTIGDSSLIGIKGAVLHMMIYGA